MNIIVQKPYLELDSLMEDSFFTSFPRLGFDLAVTMYEEEGKVIVKMNVPGVCAEDLDVTIKDGVLTVAGTRAEEEHSEDREYYAREIRTGSFFRSVRMPHSVDSMKVTADFSDGVLVLSAPLMKDKKSQEVRIEVKQTV